MPATAPTLQAIIARIKADFRSVAGVDALFGSPEYGLLYSQAAQSKGQYSYQEYLNAQAFADTADEPNFWRHAALRGIYQKPATPWRGLVTFTGTNGTLIPAGTMISRSDGQEYTTDDDATVVGTVVQVAVTGTTAASAGNNVDGQVLVLSSPIIAIESETIVAETTVDGTDPETQADGLVRYLIDVRKPSSSGGTSGDYIRWALEVPGVTRAWEQPLSSGEVSVQFVRDNDGIGDQIIPDEGERLEVQSYVQAKAPITVTVLAATLVAAPVDIVLSDLEPNTTAVQNAIIAELQDFFSRFGEVKPGATISLSRLNAAISAAADETSHVMSTPAVDVTFAPNEMPILGTVSFPL